MNVRTWPKRVQGWAIMVTGFVMWWFTTDLGAKLPAVPMPNGSEATIDVAVMMFGFAYMVGLGFGDQLRKAVRPPAKSTSPSQGDHDDA